MFTGMPNFDKEKNRLVAYVARTALATILSCVWV